MTVFHFHFASFSLLLVARFPDFTLNQQQRPLRSLVSSASKWFTRFPSVPIIGTFDCFNRFKHSTKYLYEMSGSFSISRIFTSLWEVKQAES